MSPPAPFRHFETVNWGDCDPAGIVFYPNFFRWIDNGFHAMTRSCGFDQARLATTFGLLGTPLAEASARFMSPARAGDRLQIDIRLTRLGRSSVAVRHDLTVSGRPVARLAETRVFARDTADGPRSAPVPDSIASRLRAHLMDGA